MVKLTETTLILITLLLASPVWAEEGWATYYTEESCKKEGTSGVLTANGERYLEAGMTCALPSRCFGCKVRVTSLTTGKSIILRHNDYGPGKKPRSKGVVVDLTPAAFKALGHSLKEGRIPVEVESL